MTTGLASPAVSRRDARRIRTAERDFLELYRAFLRYERLSDIEAIVALWNKLRDTSSLVPEMTVRFSGWISKRSGFRLSRRELQNRNRNYRLSVDRERRADAPDNPVRDGVLLGYRVVATATQESPPFQLVVADRAGGLVTPPPSSDVARHRLSVLSRNDRDLRFADSDLMFIEDVSVLMPGVYSDLAIVILSQPEASLDIVNQAAAHGFAEYVLKTLQRAPLLDRESDRAALTALGDAFETTSDLEKLTVARLDEWSASNSSRMTLAPVRKGSLIDYAPGETVLPSPSREWHTINGALVQDGGTIVTGQRLIVYESAADPSINQLSTFGQRAYGSPVNENVALLTRLRLADKVIAEAILISGRHDGNWYHWMAEYLPRALDVPTEIDSAVPLLVSDRVPPEGLRALSEITKRSVLVARHDTAQRVQLLHVSAPVLQVLDATTRVPWGDGLAIRAEAVRLAATTLIQAAGADELTPNRLLYVCRRSAHRSLVNERQLSRIATELGFELVEPGEMTWSEQVRAFRSARIVVGANGAVMANYLFMAPGTQAIGLTASGLEGFILPATIAETVGVRFSAITGSHVTPLSHSPSKNKWIHSDFAIPSAAFTRGLQAALARA